MRYYTLQALHRWISFSLTAIQLQHLWIGSLFLVVFIFFFFLLCHSFTLSLPHSFCGPKVLISKAFYTIRLRMNICIFLKNFPLLLGNFVLFCIHCFHEYGSVCMSAKIFMKSNKWTINSKPLTHKNTYTFLWRIGHCVLEKKQQTIAEWSIHIETIIARFILALSLSLSLSVVSLLIFCFYFNSTLADQQREYKLFQHFAFLFIVQRKKYVTQTTLKRFSRFFLPRLLFGLLYYNFFLRSLSQHNRLAFIEQMLVFIFAQIYWLLYWFILSFGTVLDAQRRDKSWRKKESQ